MKHVRSKPDPIHPSAPDPVEAWLDVLVAMLSIPKADRQRVRDELEDHLRSRIDDLLIHGLTEPQALQKAVAELGETADLARQLSHAHKPPRTRRYAMHALIIALAGTVVAFGVNTMRPQAGLPTTAVPVSATVASMTHAPSQAPTDLLSLTIEVPAGGELSIQEHFERFAAKAGLTLEIDRAALGEFGIMWSEKGLAYPESHSGSITLARTLDRSMNAVDHDLWASGGGLNRFVAAEVNGKLLITTAYGLDVRTSERRVYPLARFAENAPDPVQGTHAEVAYERLLRAVSQHVSPMDWQDNGGDLATGTVLGSSLIVTAPARIHEQIETLLDDLHAQVIQQAEQRQAAESARREAAAREHTQLVARIRSEYRRALSELDDLTNRVEKLTVSGSRLQGSLANLPAESREEATKPIDLELAGINAEVRALRTRMEETTARVVYLRSRMIEIEYEPLVISRELTSTRNPNVQPGLVEIRGDVARVGMYEHHAGLTLRRMLLTAGWTPESVSSTIQLIRDGEVVGEWSARSLSGVDAAILPGDIIAVVD